MGMLDFLFPVLMAANARVKIKSEKDAEIERKRIRKEYDDLSKSINYYQNLYSDKYLELEKLENQIVEDRSCAAEAKDRLFVFDDMIRSCKSYDENENNKNRDLMYILFDPLGKNIALAKIYGKIPILTFAVDTFCCFKAGKEYNKEWWGRREYKYEAQIFHELMQSWHLYMKENNFPFDLKVIDLNDDKEKKIYKRNDGTVVTDINDFKGGFLYYWDVPTQWRNWVYHRDFPTISTTLTL